MQLEPWLDAFGRENVLVICFEDYVVDRRAGLQSLSRFIGVDPQVYSVAPATIHNRSEGKPVLNSFWATLTSSAFYRRFIRNLLPLRARDLLRKALLPKSSPRPAEPSPATVAMLIDRLQLGLLLSGIELSSVRRRKRYQVEQQGTHGSS